VLGFLSIIAFTMVSAPVVWDVTKGFFSFGTLPLPPANRIVGNNFDLTAETRDATVHVKGTWEDGTVSGDLAVTRGAKTIALPLQPSDRTDTGKRPHWQDPAKLPTADGVVVEQLLRRAQAFAGTDRFMMNVHSDDDPSAPAELSAEGNVPLGTDEAHRQAGAASRVLHARRGAGAFPVPPGEPSGTREPGLR
jgi:hypothetical protein